MRFLLLLAAVGFCSIAYSQDKELTTFPPPDEIRPSYVISSAGDTVQLVVDEQAAFPGGSSALRKFIGEHLVYPSGGDEDIYGKVYLRLVIRASGHVIDPSILRGIPDCPQCSDAVIKMATSMPLWTPATFHGKPVSSYFYLPISFSLSH